MDKESGTFQEDMSPFARQLKLVGEEGQKLLEKSTVLVAGVGGLGGTAALYLAAAGVGKLILVHEGIIKPPDLNRQILMDASRIGEPRIPCAVESIKRINPRVEIEAYPERITVDRAVEWAAAADIVIDARYDFPERYALNDACRKVGVPMVEAAMYAFEISLSVIVPGETPCLECLYPVPDQGWEPLGFPVLGATSGMAGTMAALEAVKWITGIGRPAAGEMVRINTLDLSSIRIKLEDTPLCPACAERRHTYAGIHQAAR
jgi:molybdopterin/thiamine biosynthesis adenylyltransferase